MAKEFKYPYGKLYDINIETLPGKGHYDIIVYKNVENSTRAIGSLEGIFVSQKDIANTDLPTGESIFVKRNKMQDFEKKFKGEFLPFKETMEITQ